MLYSVKLKYSRVCFIHPFNKYLWSVDHEADNILGPREIIMNREDKFFDFVTYSLKWSPDLPAPWNHLKIFKIEFIGVTLVNISATIFLIFKISFLFS